MCSGNKNKKNLDYRAQNGYRILPTAATSEKNGSPEGGVAIIISGEMAPMIKNVIRYDERVIQVTLQNSAYDIPVNILSIYAPPQWTCCRKETAILEKLK